MPRTQMERDLFDFSEERLHQWAIDTIQRCEIVDMDQGRIMSMLYTLLMGEMVHLTRALKMNEDQFNQLMCHMLHMYRRMAEAEKKSREV